MKGLCTKRSRRRIDLICYVSIAPRFLFIYTVFIWLCVTTWWRHQDVYIPTTPRIIIFVQNRRCINSENEMILRINAFAYRYFLWQSRHCRHITRLSYCRYSRNFEVHFLISTKSCQKCIIIMGRSNMTWQFRVFSEFSSQK